MDKLAPAMNDELENDGERFLPETMEGVIALEHFHRYQFATQFVSGKVVLDIACGEGYGSALLAKSAEHVVGIDIAPKAIAHARKKYRDSALTYLCGDCASIPLADRSVDVVVSFETIEHVSDHQKMMQEVKRVLRPGGVLVISSPDKLEYSEKPSFENRHHVKELYREEFESLLKEYFKHVQFLGQRVLFGSALVGTAGMKDATFVSLGESAVTEQRTELPNPLYWVGVASDRKAKLAQGGLLEQPLSSASYPAQDGVQLAELLRALATPNSPLLQSYLNNVWYLRRNSDLVEADVDPVDHWWNIGFREGRLPAADNKALLAGLLDEREQFLRAQIQSKEREVAQAQREFAGRIAAAQEQLLAFVESAARKEGVIREEGAKQFRDLSEHARESSELAKSLQSANAEMQTKSQAIAEAYVGIEVNLQQIIAEKESELRRLRQENFERQRALESELAQGKLRARYEIEALMRSSTERENALAAELTRVRELNAAEREVQIQEWRLREEALEREYSRKLRDLNDVLAAKDAELAYARASAEQYAIEFKAALAAAQSQSLLEMNAQADKFLQAESEFARRIEQVQDDAARERMTQVASYQAQIAEMAQRHQSETDNLRQLLRVSELKLTQVQQQVLELREQLSKREREFAATSAANERTAHEAVSEAKDEATRSIRMLSEAHLEEVRLLTQQLALQAAEGKKDQELARERQQALLQEVVDIQKQTRAELEASRQLFDDKERALIDQLANERRAKSDEVSSITLKYESEIAQLQGRLTEVESTWVWRSWERLQRTTSTLLRRKLEQTRGGGQAKDPSLTGSLIAEQFGRNDDQKGGKRALAEQVSAAGSVKELLAHDGQSFLVCAYLTLLGRQPDTEGLEYYSGRMAAGFRKLEIVYEIFRGPEARTYGAVVRGLAWAMSMERLRQIALVRALVQRNNRVTSKSASPRQTPIAKSSETSPVPHGEETSISNQDKSKLLLEEFDPIEYLEANPDVAAAGINPYEHYCVHGWNEGRRLHVEKPIVAARSADANGSTVDVNVEVEVGAIAEPTVGLPAVCDGRPPVSERLNDKCPEIEEYFMQPADEVLQGTDYTFTKLMHYIWSSRLDLQAAFDIFEPHQRLNYLRWFVFSAYVEYGLTPSVYPRTLLMHLLKSGDEEMVNRVRAILELQMQSSAPSEQDAAISSASTSGANLVGYAFGEFGMGEHVRMVARALSTTTTPFVIIDQHVGLHGDGDRSVSQWISETPRHGTNIFHVNADVFPPLYFKFGRGFFSSRYNVGYWAWELPKCPPEFDLALGMVNEVWAISDFVADSFRARSPVPVVTMPLAVTVPELGEKYTKSYFGLPTEKFLFFFTFDAASYLDRKNPHAVVRAFQRAFPDTDENVHLLLKTMNTELAGDSWRQLVSEIGEDPRISVMNQRLTREEVLGLNVVCDAFISLHRSEGFGRCVAEAMAYGKPVICTDFSGTRDFAKEHTACLVDYKLIPVPSGAYPFAHGQVWADPDIDCAAGYMRRLFSDPQFRALKAVAGQNFIREHFNERVIGDRYSKRLAEIERIRSSSSGSQEEQALPESSVDCVSNNSVEATYGCIDTPSPDQSVEISEAFPVQGWIASIHAVQEVVVSIDTREVGLAHYGVLRPDVGVAYPELPESARSGYCFRAEVDSLGLGVHELRVTAKLVTGRQPSWSTSFEVIRPTKYLQWIDRTESTYAKSQTAESMNASVNFTIILLVAAEARNFEILRTIESIANQYYPNFTIRIVGGKARRRAIEGFTKQYSLSGRCKFSNTPIDRWEGEAEWCKSAFISVIDAGDVYRPWALSDFADEIDRMPTIDLLYADEDTLQNGERAKPKLKPSWSPVFLLTHNYIGRPWAARTSILANAAKQVGDEQLDVREHALLIATGNLSETICHVPKVLISRRDRGGGAALMNSAPTLRCINRSPVAHATGSPRISIIIPTMLGNASVIERCLEGLFSRTSYKNIEVIILTNNLPAHVDAGTFLNRWPLRIEAWSQPFNWSAINNYGAQKATGEYLLFMNDDVEPIAEEWLETMLRCLTENDVGVVGPLLKYPNGSIQHAGIGFFGQVARHLFRLCRGDESHLQWVLANPREVAAVTGACLLTSKQCFSALGGFDESFPLVCNDTDYCLRARQAGFSVIFTPKARLLHHEGISRQGLMETEAVSHFSERWSDLLCAGDNFMNPHLDSARDDWEINPMSNTSHWSRVTANAARNPLRRASTIVDQAPSSASSRRYDKTNSGALPRNSKVANP